MGHLYMQLPAQMSTNISKNSFPFDEALQLSMCAIINALLRICILLSLCLWMKPASLRRHACEKASILGLAQY